ncbi:MAG: cyclic nucleotide-binding domain-containing protein [Bdellovibrionaceae bacterium]|nr:cyclic nucleotide-binding domain-containing protein [Pseudobdellovibrionaceae bacterium]MDW8190898.1 cyclic nucleotide-binding domain-containing protein [Pseudobdellovibrionaceae bacterium]
MNEIRTYQKNEVIFKENEKISHIYFVQSGKISLGWVKNNKFIELPISQVPTILGEQALSGVNIHSYQAVAIQETKVLQIPVEQLKNQLDTISQVFKMIVKLSLDKHKFLFNELKALKLEQQAVPFPEDKIAKCFMSLYVASVNKGQTHRLPNSEKTVVTIQWPSLKLYLHKMFDEPPKRCEFAIQILKKIGLAEIIMGTPPDDPEGAEVILEVQFLDIKFLEWFSEFYQYYYFRPDKAHVVRYEEFIFKMIEIILELAKKDPSHKGNARIAINKLNEQLKKTLNTQFSSDHQLRLENKGVLLKRVTHNQESLLELEVPELERMLSAWRISHEIDKLNQKGFVDFNEQTNLVTDKTDSLCPQCSEKIEKNHKFCPQCGYRLCA